MPNALITGASSGIGRATALELARRGFHVIAAGRSEIRASPTLEEIVRAGGSAEYLHVDLASLDSARDAAQRFEHTRRELDVLINNSGVGATRGLSKDGFEIHFAVNHLGHFMLTHHLRRTFRPGTRIVQVTSAIHFRAEGIDFDAVHRRSGSLYGVREYAVSKLANILFVREMARRQPDWRLYAVHPGLTDTGIIPWYAKGFMRRNLLTPSQGADTVVWCATTPELGEESGLYYARRSVESPSKPAQDETLARELWRRSELWCEVAPLH